MKAKLGSNAGGGPTPADWEAMQAKIAAQPALQPAATGGKVWLSWLLAGSVGLAIGLGSWFLWPNAAGEQSAIEPMSEIQDSDLVINPSLQPAELNQGSISESKAKSIESSVGIDLDPSETLGDNITFQASENGELEEDLGGNLSGDESSRSHFPERSISEVSERANKAVSQEPSIQRDQIGELPARDLSGLAGPTKIKKASDLGNIEEPVTENQERSELGDSDQASTEGLPLSQFDGERKESLVSDEGRQGTEEIESRQNQSLKEESDDSMQELSDSNVAEMDTVPPIRGERMSAEDAALFYGMGQPVANPILNPKTGFHLHQASLYSSYLNEFRPNSPWALGLGVDLQWSRMRQFFSAGLAYYRIEQPFIWESNQINTRVDSLWTSEIRNREVINVTRIWVIDSFQAGRYVYDTTITMVTDTVYNFSLDTNQSSMNIVNQSVRTYYYAELPLMYGYQYRTGNWTYQLAGGVALQQAVGFAEGEGRAKSFFGVSALMQPALNWHLSDQWSILARAQMRYPLLQDVALFEEQRLRYSFQMGVSYRW